MSTGASVAAFVAQSAWFKLGALCGALAVVTGALARRSVAGCPRTHGSP